MMVNGSSLSENELKALTYFAVGVSSEGSVRGRDVSNRLSFAGRIAGGKMYPIQMSGLSIGTLQKDLGQDRKETASALMRAYQAWAIASRERPALTSVERDAAIKALSRNGDAIRDQGNAGVDARLKANLDAFLRVDEGRDFVHQRDMTQVDSIYGGPLSRLVKTPAYQDASAQDRIKMATVVAKAFNQNPAVADRMLRRMDSGRAEAERLNSFDDVRAYTDRHFSNVMKEGRDAALNGAQVFDALRGLSADNPLHEAWAVVVDDPLITPSQVILDDRPDFRSQYSTIKNLFLEPGNAKPFIEALERGSDYGHGRPHAVGDSGPTSGFFATGTTLVQWNRDGRGAVYIDGSWSEASRDDISHTKNGDGSVDLAVGRGDLPAHRMHLEPAGPSPARSERLRALRQGMHGEDVRALQAELARLEFKDARGRPLPADGDFGAATHSAIQVFQKNHHLAADGVAGPATLGAIREAVESQGRSAGQWHAPYLSGQRHSDAMSAYGALTPERAVTLPYVTVPTEPPEPVTSAPPRPVDQAGRDAVRNIQERLNTLGIRDMDGDALVPSGIYDVATRTAVARFQSEQSLPVTGTADDTTVAQIQGRAFIADLDRSVQALTFPEQAGRGETWLAMSEQPTHALPDDGQPIARAVHQDSALIPPRLDHPAHPDHEFFREVRKHVVELDRSLGRGPDHFTDNISSALTVQARADGLERVDHIELSERGDVLRAVQTPHRRMGHQSTLSTKVATAEAETPMERSAEMWPDAMRQFEGHELARAEIQQRAVDRQQSIAPGLSQSLATPEHRGHPLNDPRNPDNRHHALYKELERCLPDPSHERLLQFTAVCHSHRINERNLSGVHVNYDDLTLHLDSDGLMAMPAVVDLSVPPPEAQESIQHIQQFDQQMEQIRQQSQQQAAQMSQQGPVM
jgi:peptidoglycan hydrolase-like protein with peptidoglycan-binding domain